MVLFASSQLLSHHALSLRLGEPHALRQRQQLQSDHFEAILERRSPAVLGVRGPNRPPKALLSRDHWKDPADRAASVANDAIAGGGASANPGRDMGEVAGMARS